MSVTTNLLDGCEPVVGGYIVRRTDTYVVDVVCQIYNWRLHVSNADEYGKTYVHGYCYFGTGAETLAGALVAAHAWEDPLHTDPIGYGKKAF